MSYIDKNLMDGESVAYRTRMHWIVFKSAFIYAVIAALLFSAGKQVEEVWGVVFAVIAFIVGLNALIIFLTSEFAVTSHRVIVKAGFIRRASLEILLSKVEAIGVRQGILGRILGYGNVHITGSGGTRDPFRKIANPLEFRKRAQEQISSIPAA